MRYSFLYSLTAVALLVSSCGSDKEDPIVDAWEDAVDEVTITVPAFEPGDEASRTLVDWNGTDPQFTWKVGDKICIFGQYGKSGFPFATSGTGTSAAFESSEVLLRKNVKYSASFPYDGTSAENKDSILVNFTGQVQNGNNSTAHLGKYDYMYSPYGTLDAEGKATFQMKHMCSLVKFVFTFSSSYEFTKFELTNNTHKFITKGYYKLTDSTPKFVMLEESPIYRLTLNGVTSTNELTVYTMLPPGTHNGDEWSINIGYKDGVLTKTMGVSLTVHSDLEAGKFYVRKGNF